jgi:hypothetical protein
VQAAPIIWSPQFHLHLPPEARQAARPASLAFARPSQVMRDTHHRVQTLFRTIYRTQRVAGPVQWLNRVEMAVPAVARRAATPRGLLLRLPKERQFGCTQGVAVPVQLPDLNTRLDLLPADTEVRAGAPPLVGRRSAPWRGKSSSHELRLGSRAMRSVPTKVPMAARNPFRALPAVHRSGSLQSPQTATTPIARRTQQPRLPTTQPSATPARPQDHLYRPIDIVWKRRRSTAGSTAEPESDGRPSRSVEWTASAHTAPSEPRAPVSQEPAPGPASLNLSDIDPRLLDRLTDNVIRRVERHVRIERERRGL